MQEAIYTLPKDQKSTYMKRRDRLLHPDIPRELQVQLLADLEEDYVEFQRVIDATKRPVAPEIKVKKPLIPVLKVEGEVRVDARTLHEFLNVGKDFSTWLKERVDKYGWVEGEDYFVVFDSP